MKKWWQAPCVTTLCQRNMHRQSNAPAQKAQRQYKATREYFFHDLLFNIARNLSNDLTLTT
jgi:hypothetical protein